jgi:hypothetical protein
MYKLAVFIGVLLLCASGSLADDLSEGFNDISSLPGWAMVNNSTAGGTTGWFQGTEAFSAQAGPADSYIAANYLNAGFGGDISNWLITPEESLTNGTLLTFYTRTETDAAFADRLEVRLSTNGLSTDVGATTTSVGDFTTLLLTINPSLDPSGYPDDWTAYSVVLSGLGAGVNGRIAFRYDVTDTSLNADFIGIDTVSLTPATATPEPATMFLFLGAAALGAGKFFRKQKQANLQI